METDTQRMTALYFQKTLLLQKVAEEFPPSYVVKFSLVPRSSLPKKKPNIIAPTPFFTGAYIFTSSKNQRVGPATIWGEFYHPALFFERTDMKKRLKYTLVVLTLFFLMMLGWWAASM